MTITAERPALNQDDTQPPDRLLYELAADPHNQGDPRQPNALTSNQQIAADVLNERTGQEDPHADWQHRMTEHMITTHRLPAEGESARNDLALLNNASAPHSVFDAPTTERAGYNQPTAEQHRTRITKLMGSFTRLFAFDKMDAQAANRFPGRHRRTR